MILSVTCAHLLLHVLNLQILGNVKIDVKHLLSPIIDGSRTAKPTLHAIVFIVLWQLKYIQDGLISQLPYIEV